MRVKTGSTRHQHHHKILDLAKGHRLARSKHYKVAREEVLHAGQYAFVGRKLRKRDFRRLWNIRINAGLAQIENGPSYSLFINLLKQKHVDLNRKMLALLAAEDMPAFKQIVSFVYGK